MLKKDSLLFAGLNVTFNFAFSCAFIIAMCFLSFSSYAEEGLQAKESDEIVWTFSAGSKSGGVIYGIPRVSFK